MRNISDELKAHLASELTTVCVCWKIKRKDGTILGFTSRSSDFAYNDSSGDGSVTYKASTGISPTTTKETIGTGIDNLDVIGTIDSPDITAEDLHGGLYDSAQVTIFYLNYQDLTMGHCVLMRGRIGQITSDNVSFTVEIRSLSQLLAQQIGRVTTPLCDAEFCDSRCKLNVATYTHTGTVTSVESRRVFTVSSFSAIDDNRFQLGKCTFTSGNNNGKSMEIKYNDGGEIELQIDMPFDITVGDTISVVEGCDKLHSTCHNMYDNVINFRGFPHIPGVDAVLNIVPG